MHILSVLIAMFLFTGCSVPRSRSEYAVEQADELVTSNSVMLQEHPRPEKRESGSYEIKYPVLLQNVSKTSDYTILLKESAFKIKDWATPAQCSFYKSVNKGARVGPGQKVRIDCKITVKPDASNKLLSRDIFGTLVIPYLHKGATKTLSFKYNLKIEDFE